MEVGLTPHGFDFPPEDHCRQEGSGPRRPNTLVTTKDPLPFATRSLRSDFYRSHTPRCVQTLRAPAIEHRAALEGAHAEPWEALAWPGFGTSYQATRDQMDEAALQHQHHGCPFVYM